MGERAREGDEAERPGEDAEPAAEVDERIAVARGDEGQRSLAGARRQVAVSDCGDVDEGDAAEDQTHGADPQVELLTRHSQRPRICITPSGVGQLVRRHCPYVRLPPHDSVQRHELRYDRVGHGDPPVSYPIAPAHLTADTQVSAAAAP